MSVLKKKERRESRILLMNNATMAWGFGAASRAAGGLSKSMGFNEWLELEDTQLVC